MFWSIRILLILAVVPGAILMYLVYRQDRVEKESPKLLAKLFIFGALTVISAMILELIGGAIVNRLLGDTEYPFIFCYFFLVVGLAEELGKFVVLKLATWKNPEFNYHFDAIVYAVFTGMGFAIVENVMYVFTNGIATGLMRAVTALPGHLTFAVFMGHFYGQAKYCEANGDEKGKRLNLFLSLVVPVAVHGMYDTLASLNIKAGAVIFIAFIILMDILAYRRVKKNAAGDAPFRAWNTYYSNDAGYNDNNGGNYGGPY